MKLPVISEIEVIKKLKQKGSHVRLEKVPQDETARVTVPLHAELKKGTLARIIKDADITVEEF